MNSMHNSFGGGGGGGGYSSPYPGYMPPSALPYYNGYPGELAASQNASAYYGKSPAAMPGYSTGMGGYSTPNINNSMYYQQYGLGYQYGYGKYGLGAGLTPTLGYGSELGGAASIAPSSLGGLQAPTTDLGLTGSMFSKGSSNKYSALGNSSPHSLGSNQSNSSMSSAIAQTPPSHSPHSLPNSLRGHGATPSPPVDISDGKKDLDKMRRCQLCGQVFRLMSECLAHMKAVHEAPMSMYGVPHSSHASQSLVPPHMASHGAARSSSLSNASDSPLMALERMGWGKDQNLMPSLHSASPISQAYGSSMQPQQSIASHQLNMVPNPHLPDPRYGDPSQQSAKRLNEFYNSCTNHTSSNQEQTHSVVDHSVHHASQSTSSSNNSNNSYKSRKSSSYSVSSIIGENIDNRQDKKELLERGGIGSVDPPQTHSPSLPPSLTPNLPLTSTPNLPPNLSPNLPSHVHQSTPCVHPASSQPPHLIPNAPPSISQPPVLNSQVHHTPPSLSPSYGSQPPYSISQSPPHQPQNSLPKTQHTHSSSKCDDASIAHSHGSTYTESSDTSNYHKVSTSGQPAEESNTSAIEEDTSEKLPPESSQDQPELSQNIMSNDTAPQDDRQDLKSPDNLSKIANYSMHGSLLECPADPKNHGTEEGLCQSTDVNANTEHNSEGVYDEEQSTNCSETDQLSQQIRESSPLNNENEELLRNEKTNALEAEYQSQRDSQSSLENSETSDSNLTQTPYKLLPEELQQNDGTCGDQRTTNYIQDDHREQDKTHSDQKQHSPIAEPEKPIDGSFSDMNESPADDQRSSMNERKIDDASADSYVNTVHTAPLNQDDVTESQYDDPAVHETSLPEGTPVVEALPEPTLSEDSNAESSTNPDQSIPFKDEEKFESNYSEGHPNASYQEMPKDSSTGFLEPTIDNITKTVADEKKKISSDNTVTAEVSQQQSADDEEIGDEDEPGDPTHTLHDSTASPGPNQNIPWSSTPTPVASRSSPIPQPYKSIQSPHTPPQPLSSLGISPHHQSHQDQSNPYSPQYYGQQPKQQMTAPSEYSDKGSSHTPTVPKPQQPGPYRGSWPPGYPSTGNTSGGSNNTYGYPHQYGSQQSCGSASPMISPQSASPSSGKVPVYPSHSRYSTQYMPGNFDARRPVSSAYSGPGHWYPGSNRAEGKSAWPNWGSSHGYPQSYYYGGGGPSTPPLPPQPHPQTTQKYPPHQTSHAHSPKPKTTDSNINSPVSSPQITPSPSTESTPKPPASKKKDSSKQDNSLDKSKTSNTQVKPRARRVRPGPKSRVDSKLQSTPIPPPQKSPVPPPLKSPVPPTLKSPGPPPQKPPVPPLPKSPIPPPQKSPVHASHHSQKEENSSHLLFVETSPSIQQNGTVNAEVLTPPMTSVESSDSSDSDVDDEPRLAVLKPAKRFRGPDGSFVGPKRIKLAKMVRQRQHTRQKLIQDQIKQTELEEQITQQWVERAAEEEGPLANVLLKSSVLLSDQNVDETEMVDERVASVTAQLSDFAQIGDDETSHGKDRSNNSLLALKKTGRRNTSHKTLHNNNSVVIKHTTKRKSLPKLRAKDFKWSHYIKSMRYWCKDCGHGFKNPKESQQHEEEQCKMNCLYMLECYVDVPDIVQHKLYGSKVEELLEEYQVDGQHKCGRCGATVSRKADFLVHLDTHKDFMPWECTICGTRFKIRGSLKEHLRYTHMKGRVPCLKCNKVFPTSTLLRQHVKVHTQHYKYSRTGKHREEDLRMAREALDDDDTSTPSDQLSEEANEYRNWCKLMEINAMKNIATSDMLDAANNEGVESGDFSGGEENGNSNATNDTAAIVAPQPIVS